MFQLDYDPVANILNMSVKGFWSAEQVTALAQAVGAKVQAVRAIRDDFDVVVESFDFPVQANDVADLLTSVMQGGLSMTTGRAAVVVGSQLNKLQAERTLVHPRLRVFLTMAEAREWLGQRVVPST